MGLETTVVPQQGWQQMTDEGMAVAGRRLRRDPVTGRCLEWVGSRLAAGLKLQRGLAGRAWPAAAAPRLAPLTDGTACINAWPAFRGMQQCCNAPGHTICPVLIGPFIKCVLGVGKFENVKLPGNHEKLQKSQKNVGEDLRGPPTNSSFQRWSNSDWMVCCQDVW